MANLNRVILLGNLTRDPEVRNTPSGMAVGDLRLAVSRKFKGNDGGEREETCYVDVTVWGRQAETAANYLRKGSAVLIEGRLKYDEWEKEGQKHNRLSVVAERWQFAGGGRGGERAAAAETPAPTAAETPAPAAAAEAPERPAPPEAAADADDLPF